METREGEGLPLSGIAIILVLLGAFFLRETPLTGSRPGGPLVPHHDPEGAQRVPARLWLEDESLASRPLYWLATLVQAFRDATSGDAQTVKDGGSCTSSSRRRPPPGR